MVQANVDRIIDFLKTKKTASIPEISKSLNIPKEDVQKSAEYLEEDGVLKMDYKFTTPYATFVKDPFSQGDIPALHLEEPKKEQPRPPAAQSQQKLESGFFLNEPNAPGKADNSLMQSPMKASPEAMSYVKLQTDEMPKDDLKITIPDVNPFEENPNFELGAPAPDNAPATDMQKPVMKPVLGYTEEYHEDRPLEFPDYVTSDIDKLDFMIDEANKSIKNYKYKGLNVTYRKIFNLYKEAELSPNERYLMGNKLTELFQRMRRIYTVEHTV